MTTMSLSLIPMKSFTLLTISLSMMMMMCLLSLMQPMMISSIQMDNTSMLMISLTIFTTLMTVMASSIIKMIPLIISINIFLILAFSSSSLLSFYIFFELSIIPTFMLIMNKGNQPERLKASTYLLMYTIFASLPLMMGIIMVNPFGKMTLLFTNSIQLTMPLIFIMAFLVKLPMFSFHLWLPKAHVEAPMEGSMILAAILLKLGSYGLMRMLPLMKTFMKTYSPIMMSISLMGCIYSTLTCNRQKDMKSMVAYSSVAHMALIIISLFSMSSQGHQAAMLMTISHGTTSSALFMITTLTYSSYHTRNLFLFKGFSNTNMNLSFWWFILLAANIGTPPFITLMSEIMSISSSIQWSLMTLIPIMISCMLMASFSISMYSMINHNSTNQNTPSMLIKPHSHITLMAHVTPMLLMIMNPTLMT